MKLRLTHTRNALVNFFEKGIQYSIPLWKPEEVFYADRLNMVRVEHDNLIIFAKGNRMKCVCNPNSATYLTNSKVELNQENSRCICLKCRLPRDRVCEVCKKIFETDFAYPKCYKCLVESLLE